VGALGPNQERDRHPSGLCDFGELLRAVADLTMT